MNDVNILLMDAMSLKRDVPKTYEKKRLLISLIEPTIEYIVRHIFADTPKVSCAVVTSLFYHKQSSIWMSTFQQIPEIVMFIPGTV